MKKLTLGAAALLLWAAPLGAQQRTESVGAAPDARIRVNNPTGPTSVVAWERSEVQMVASGPAAQDVQIKRDGRLVEVIAPAGISLMVRVPKGAVLEVRSGSGPIQIRGIENTIEAESGSGPIMIDATPRSITAVGFSGGVQIRGGGTEITRAESASGSVSVTQARGVVDLSSSSGAVMANGNVRDAKLFSVSGAVSFNGAVENGGRVSLESSSGSISIRVPANASADYELSTVSGHIQNSFGPRGATSGVGGSSLRFSVRGGGARIKASTVSGSVQLNER